MIFAKLQATGNDFVLLDARNLNVDWTKTARAMCHRHLGIGADGIILVLDSKTADLRMRIFNADGSEAEICGNGLRCFTKYVLDRGIVPVPKLDIETRAGIKSVTGYAADGKITQVKVNMGKPHFKAKEIPICLDLEEKNVVNDRIPIDCPIKVDNKDLLLSLVSMGNPHAVNFVEQPVIGFPLDEIGPLIENHIMFPQRTNFGIARVINRNKIEARVWERGVGETLACGSGACAITVLAKAKGYTGEKVDIILPGGTLAVSWDGIGEVYLKGPVEEVFTGEWPR